MSGKGSAPRPYSVSYDEFSKSFDAIFKKGKENEAVERRTGCRVSECMPEDGQGEVPEPSRVSEGVSDQ